METAVYVDIVARSIPQTVAAQQTDRTGYILRCSPARNGEGSFFNQIVVLTLYFAGHVCGDHTGAYLVDQNSFGCQIEIPALDTQYSPRLVEDTTELQLDTLTITPLRPSKGSC